MSHAIRYMVREFAWELEPRATEDEAVFSDLSTVQAG